MEISKYPVVSGKFISRRNRFVAEILLTSTNERVEAHVPNTGRMKELLTKDAEVGLAYCPSPTRKTDYTLITVRYHQIWVCIDAVAANRLVYHYLSQQKGIRKLQREVTYRDSRFDLAREDENGYGYVEVKSVNLVIETSDHRNRCACFPDAPTKRGTKHIKELTSGLKEHQNNALYFVVQRNDADCFVPNQSTDPEFTQAFQNARQNGLDVHVLLCDVTIDHMNVIKEIPVYALDDKGNITKGNHD